MPDTIDDLRDILKQAKDHNPLAYPLIAPVYERTIAEIERLRAVKNAAKEFVRVSDLISSTAKDRRIALINLRALI